MKKLFKAFVCLILTPFAPIEWICWFSKEFNWNIHDYHVNRGGDGVPFHFCKHKCWNCGMEFDI